jgi:hypothetical protein
MKTSSFILIALFLFFAACKKPIVLTESDKTTDSGLLIKAGFVCGWGSGTDSLEISRTIIRYDYYVPSRSDRPIIHKSRSVSDNEWKQIVNDINIDDFFQLNYQSCNVCFDGCDEWIFMQNGKLSHIITFAKGLEIDTISKLQNKLAELRREFNE